jgi:hypothetical protein
MPKPTRSALWMSIYHPILNEPSVCGGTAKTSVCESLCLTNLFFTMKLYSLYSRAAQVFM